MDEILRIQRKRDSRLRFWGAFSVLFLIILTVSASRRFVESIAGGLDTTDEFLTQTASRFALATGSRVNLIRVAKTSDEEIRDYKHKQEMFAFDDQQRTNMVDVTGTTDMYYFEPAKTLVIMHFWNISLARIGPGQYTYGYLPKIDHVSVNTDTKLSVMVVDLRSLDLTTPAAIIASPAEIYKVQSRLSQFVLLHGRPFDLDMARWMKSYQKDRDRQISEVREKIWAVAWFVFGVTSLIIFTQLDKLHSGFLGLRRVRQRPDLKQFLYSELNSFTKLEPQAVRPRDETITIPQSTYVAPKLDRADELMRRFESLTRGSPMDEEARQMFERAKVSENPRQQRALLIAAIRRQKESTRAEPVARVASEPATSLVVPREVELLKSDDLVVLPLTNMFQGLTEVVYDTGFMAIYNSMELSNQKQVVKALNYLMTFGPAHPSLGTNKPNLAVIGLPSDFFQSRASRRWRFLWSRSGQSLTVHMLFQRGNGPFGYTEGGRV